MLIGFAVLAGVAQPAAASVSVSFSRVVNPTYQQGSGEAVPFNVYGSLPAGTELMVEAWSDAVRQRFDVVHAITAEPWRIDGAAIDALPPGRTQLRIGLRHPKGKIDLLATRWFDLKPATSGGVQPGADGEPAVGWPAGTPATYTLGSGRDLPFSVLPGVLPAGYDLLLLAQTQEMVATNREVIDAFTTRLTGNGPWTIPADKLDALPEEPITLQLLLRKNFRPVSKRMHTITVTRNPTPTVAFAAGAPTSYTQGSGVSLALNVSIDPLPAGYDLLALAQTPDKQVIPGFTISLDEAPWTIPAAKLDTLPEGAVTLQLLLRKNFRAVQQVIHTVQVTAPPQEPTLPAARFSQGTPSVYTLGSGASIPFHVDGGVMPYGTDVLVLAQTPEMIDTRVVDAFTMSVEDDGPFVIPASKLDVLPAGLVRLQLLSRDHNGGGNYSKVYHWVEIQPAPTGGEPGDTTDPTDPTNPGDPSGGDGSGGSGGDGGSGDGGDDGSDDEDPNTPEEPQPVSSPFLGINLNAPSFWSTQWDFANAFRLAKAWENDATYVFWDSDGHFPKGKWVLEWEGEDTLTVSAFQRKEIEKEHGRLVFEADPQPENPGIMIRRSGPDVRNIRLWMPGCAPEDGYASQFHPLFLERLKPFRVLRFMDYQQTNHSPVVTWADRTLPTENMQAAAPHGIAIEIMIDLCNELGVYPWFCMPHMADDDYVRRFAELVKARLNPDLKVYIEYSNECWNGQFDQFDWLKARKGATGLGSEMAQAGYEAKRDFAIWYDVFGADAPKRLVRVAAGQAANVWQVKQLIGQLGPVEGDDPAIGRGFDALSCAAYAGMTMQEAASMPADATPEDIVEAARRQWRGSLASRQAHGDLARALGVPFVAYEGGQHLTPYGRTYPWYDAYDQAQRTQAMYDFYMEILSDFEKMGGRTFMAFNYVRRVDKHGSWGHLEYQDQPLSEAPKYRAMLDYLSSPVRLQLTSGD